MPDSRSAVQFDLGTETQTIPRALEPDSPFRILVLGDFSGRRNRNLREKLGGRRPLSVDRDNFDDVMNIIGPVLDFPGLRLRFAEIEHFHPDHLYRNTGVFRDLADLKQRPVAPVAPPKPPARPASSGNLLDDIMGEEEPAIPPDQGGGDLAEFLKKVVRPHLVAREDPRQLQHAAKVDATASEVMSGILHHGDFQALEAAWRGLEMLALKLDTDGDLKLYLLDVTLEELAADPEGVERIFMAREPWALIAGNYVFGQSSQYAAVLSRIAKMARNAGSPFVAEGMPPGAEPVSEEWQALRHAPEAKWVGLALPRFLLRLPYGKKTSPIEAFDYEEMPKSDHQSYLWGNPSLCVAYLLGKTFLDLGWEMRPGALREVDGLPLHVYQEDGESMIKPCAEVLMTEKEADYIMEQGFMALASLKEQDAALLVRFQSIAEPLAALSGRWSG